MYHVKCITLSTEHAEYIKENIGTWFCEHCNTSLFPFNHIENELDFIYCVEDWPNHNKMSLSYLSDKLFLPFELNDSDRSILSDTDPDLHFYNGMSQYVTQCNYYLEPYFNEHMANKVAITNSIFSLCHVNIRSIRKNLSELESYLEVLDHEFSIIGLTETWLNDSSCEIYGINGYNTVERHRTRTGGGVALFIRDNFNFSKRNDLAHFDEDIESVYIEIGKDQLHTSRDIIIGVIYRPPNRDIASFNDKLCIALERIKKENKLCLYMQTCCTHRIYNHSVVNVCGISGELQVSNNENVFKCPSSWSGKIPRNTQIPDT